MTSGPRTLIEFQEMFPNEDACWAHLRAVRWPDGFQCPACQHRERSWLSRHRLEQCGIVDPQHLCVGSGGIAERTDEIE